MIEKNCGMARKSAASAAPVAGGNQVHGHMIYDGLSKLMAGL